MEVEEKCVFAEDGIVNIDVQDPSPMQVFAKTVGLEGLISLLKTGSERYAEQNGRMFQTRLEEKLPPQKLSVHFLFCLFLVSAAAAEFCCGFHWCCYLK